LSFDKLIGNNKIKETLSESIKRKNILHSYLFYGTEGIGKKLFATEFAKMILCEGDKKPCKICKSCVEFDSNNNPDFFVIEPDGNSLKIDQIRDMQKNILEKPVNGSKKIYIINDADKMTKEAQNCLLKTLEEPQEFIVIILISSNENNILPTVKSRCTKIYFQNINNSDINLFIKEKNYSNNLDETMLKLCNGSISRAIDIINKKELLEKTKQIVNSIEKADKIEFMNNDEFFFQNKEDINLLLEYIYILLFDIIKNKNSKINNCIQAMDFVEEAKNKLYNNNNYDMTINSMLIKIWEEFNEKNYRG
jgi:DNA polymerase-3 subunit delta'